MVASAASAASSAYADHVSVKKKTNLTPENMLPTTTRTDSWYIKNGRIHNCKYPSWKILMETLASKTPDEAKSILSNIQITDKRKLGPKAADKILGFLGLIPIIL